MPEIDLELDRVWERLPDEDEEAYKAFVVYRGLGAEATVEQACRTAAGDDASAELIARWEAWAAEWAWAGRAEKHREWAAEASREARRLAERWSSAREFYASGEEARPGLLGRLFGRRRHHRRSSGARTAKGQTIQVRPEGRHGFFKKWAQEREARRHFKAQEAAALRAAKSQKKRSLAERWTLFVRRARDEAKKKQDKGFRGWLRRRMIRIRLYAR